jgi:flagella basal body P-ring formation protein FlgA
MNSHNYNPIRQTILALILICFGPACLQAADPVFELVPAVNVTGDGVYLQQIVKSSQPLPSLRLCDAPQLGTTTDLSPAQINNFLAIAAPELISTNWIGAATVHISRKTHTLNQTEALDLLTSALQQQYVKDRGELELNMTEPWDASVVPDEPLTVKFLELPAEGVSHSFIARFQLCTATETAGTWEVSLQAHVWREVWVAHTDLMRGELLADADVTQDRRDVLTEHEALANFSPGDTTLELADSVPAGTILLAHNVKLRSVIHRGELADAVLQDGSLNISMKVEALEDGAPGQIIRARNTSSQHDVVGKVLDEHTIQISL